MVTYANKSSIFTIINDGESVRYVKPEVLEALWNYSRFWCTKATRVLNDFYRDPEVRYIFDYIVDIFNSPMTIDEEGTPHFEKEIEVKWDECLIPGYSILPGSKLERVVEFLTFLEIPAAMKLKIMNLYCDYLS
jgi:hypothetical protein